MNYHNYDDMDREELIDKIEDLEDEIESVKYEYGEANTDVEVKLEEALETINEIVNKFIDEVELAKVFGKTVSQDRIEWFAREFRHAKGD